jgi:ubiquinone/menaquinone biosynthesis C-methylase UbiE
MNSRPVFEEFYSRARDLLAPGLKNSQFAYKESLYSAVVMNIRWLDLGCGHQLFPNWVPTADRDQMTLASRCELFVGIDYDMRSLYQHQALKNKVRGDIEHLPFQDQSFDLVTANMVLEHVKNPTALLLEVRRILRSNGSFLFHTPNSIGYATVIARLLPDFIKLKLVPFLQARPAQDVFPTYYRFNSWRKINALSRSAGFRIMELRPVEASAQGVMLGPLVIPELLLIRFLRLRALRDFRTNLIGTLQKAG